MNRQFHNKRHLLTVTDKRAGVTVKNITRHIFNLNLEEKSYKISFSALPVKKEWSKNQQGGRGEHNVPGSNRFKKLIVCVRTYDLSVTNKH